MTFREQLQQVIAEKNLLTHPYYVAWSDGKLTREHLNQYARQYFHNVLAFPTYISAVHFNTPSLDMDIRVRQEILENLVEEETGPENHPALWKRFAMALGSTEQELKDTQPLPSTQRMIATFRDVCLNSPFYAGLAALYAYESQAPAVAGTKMEGLKEFYGMTDPRQYEFFSVHHALDVHHAASELELIERYADTEEKQSEALEAARRSAEAQWQFLDGVFDTYCADIAAMYASVN